jgi:predicted outer membrane repeat protein
MPPVVVVLLISFVAAAQNAGPPAAKDSVATTAARSTPAVPRYVVGLPQEQLLYKNGPSTGICDVQGCTVNVWPVGYDWEVSNSFTLPGASTINSVNLAFWEAYPHVLYGANNVALDGLTIREGHAFGSTYNGKGGGLIAYHAGKTFWPHDRAVGFTISIENCRFEENSALEGGAIYAYGKASLTVRNTVFEKNRATYGGAVLDREGSEFTYQQVTFKDNEAVEDGGATFEDYGSQARFTRAQFTDNRAGHQGGAVYEISRASQLGSTKVAVEQSTFVGNKAKEGASLYNLDKSTLTLETSSYPPGTMHNP